jgi:catechol 2,3-dioxygenase-like lactoylglutathione lyase family enzyme
LLRKTAMKRFHIHLHVQDLAQSLAFYQRLFDAQPTRVEADYAKWMLVDPPVNFAISTRGSTPGIDHVGIQTDNADELAVLKQRAELADMTLLDEGPTTCCYARSEKHWITDPQGLAWEHFHTLDNIPVFRERQDEPAAGGCCAPQTRQEPSACCGPAESAPVACCAPAGTPAARCC